MDLQKLNIQEEKYTRSGKKILKKINEPVLKGGRPLKDESEKVSEKVTIGLTKSEKKRFLKESKMEAMSLASYLRKKLITRG